MNPNECCNIEQLMSSGTKIFKMSQFLTALTSSALTPYYSYRAFCDTEICSTSHYVEKSEGDCYKRRTLCVYRGRNTPKNL